MLKELQQLKDIELKYDVKILYCSEVGSKLFGTNHSESDSDYRFIYLPSLDSLILGTNEDSIKIGKSTKIKNTKDDVDFDGWSVQHWINLLKKGETNALNLLFSMFRSNTILLEDTKFTNIIKNEYKLLLTKDMRSFRGYALGQAKKFGIKGQKYAELCKFKEFIRTLSVPKTMDKEPRRLENWFNILKNHINTNKYKHIEFTMALGPKRSDNKDVEVEYCSVLGRLFEGGVDVSYFIEKTNDVHGGFGNRTKIIAKTETKADYKALSHAFMISSLCIELLKTQFMKFPVDNNEVILAIKHGQVSVDEIIDSVEHNLNEIDTLIETTNLPDKVDADFVTKVLLNLYK